MHRCRAQFSRMPRSGTKPEIALRRELHRRGLRFRVNLRGVPGSPDIAFTRARLAVFVDGCFWHGCPDHYVAPKNNSQWWADKLAENRRRDMKVDEKAGFARLDAPSYLGTPTRRGGRRCRRGTLEGPERSLTWRCQRPKGRTRRQVITHVLCQSADRLPKSRHLGFGLRNIGCNRTRVYPSLVNSARERLKAQASGRCSIRAFATGSWQIVTDHTWN